MSPSHLLRSRPLRSAACALLLVLAALAGAREAAAKSRKATSLSLGERTFVSSVRREMEAPHGGAPAIESMTNSQVSIARIKPLQEKLAALGPEVPATLRALAHGDVANALALRQLDEAAASEYLAAIETDPSFAPPWNNLASLLRRHGKHGLAQKALNAVLDLEPRNGLAWFNQALLHEDENKLEAADAAYLKALTYQPSLWLPSENPLVIGNRRAQLTLLRKYMAHGGASGSVTLDPNPVIIP